MKREEKGITLMALVITIIIMIILVGVTVNLALNGGLFNQAQTAKTKTIKETEKEALISYRAGEYYDAKTGVLNLKDLSEDTEFKEKWELKSHTGQENLWIEMIIENKESKNQYTLKLDGNIEEKK